MFVIYKDSDVSALQVMEVPSAQDAKNILAEMCTDGEVIYYALVDSKTKPKLGEIDAT